MSWRIWHGVYALLALNAQTPEYAVRTSVLGEQSNKEPGLGVEVVRKSSIVRQRQLADAAEREFVALPIAALQATQIKRHMKKMRR